MTKLTHVTVSYGDLLLRKPKMKGTARALFRVALCVRLGTGRDTRNRGVMLTTGAVTLVTWPVTLVTRSYLCKWR